MRPLRGHEDKVVAIALPRLDLWKHGAERLVDRAQGWRVDFVSLQPLNENPIVGEPIGGRAVVLEREQAGDAGSEWIRRLRGNDVVALARRLERLPGVTDRQEDLGVLQHILVDQATRASDLHDEWLQFDNVDALDRRHSAEPSGRTAGTESDDQGLPCVRSR
jgi:hypothetical protein